MEGTGSQPGGKLMQSTKLEFAAQYIDRDTELDERDSVLHLKTPCPKDLCSALSRGCVFEVYFLYWKKAGRGNVSRTNCSSVFFADGEGANVLTFIIYNLKMNFSLLSHMTKPPHLTSIIKTNEAQYLHY